ncbi:MAG TPA: YcaO-related McrA-glycine thioamidation protein [Methanothrix sp.]|uniref:YcaO-related McrA-glycine thioamidation protein n=1 Tax=Methanothrix sp. TaxID=90426 RepID=UPI002C1E2B40|nr:YcaO-related McrA-glycine thioamidation protein [Methanothrix sp.]MDI9416718.1 YcaO-related McrA-glycine thioamidation protein [Euryarchaeota archaeon]HON35508.1 YcaO-related McrA-glycine thioamidation protein [Methanothrix sp.]HRU74567.1 YcaO-related McrA-glycine thioamidation protein [Methanothrix sp.]
MKLEPCIKRYKEDTHRAVSPEETEERIEAKLPAAGITRVADITNLDRIGIPVFSSIRPMADRGAISVYNGKGATPVEARVSAMMEGLERYSGEVRDRELFIARYSSLGSEALNPVDLILPPQAVADADAPIPWVWGWDLMNDEQIIVPANAVFHPLPSEYMRLFRTNTTGLASGNTMEEAIFHGLAEVIERDAWAIVEATRRMGPLITDIQDSQARSLLERFAAAEVDVYLRDITSDIAVPTCAAAADDVKLRDPTLLTTGMGTHTSARVAVLRALTEVAQSRLTQIHGAREDTVTADFRRQIGYERTKRINRYWFDIGEKRSFSDIQSFESDDFLLDIRFMIGRLEEVGLERVVVVDLTREEIEVPVVRVIVPGLEIAGVDPERVGKRIRNARGRRLPRAKPIPS